MSAGDRFKSWIDQTAVSWKDRLTGWFAETGGAAAEAVGKRIKPESANPLKDILNELANDPDAPEEVKRLATRLLPDWGPLQDILGEIIWVLTSITSLISGNEVFKREWSLYFDSKERTARLDPGLWIALWRRFPDKYDAYIEDLKELGWSDQRIEALKDASLFYPAPADLIRWQAREVFEPEMIKRYGLDDEFGGIDLEPFRKAGMTDEQTLNYWRAHWEHASWNQVLEMLHRGQLTEDEVSDWFRLVEIPPFWREKLIATAYNVPTRVDVRRFYDLKTIDETRLREIYTAMGYHGKDLDDYVLWTKIYVELPDLISRWKNGWITLDDARRRLVEAGMNPDAADELIQTKIKVEETDEDRESKALTKTEIYKGVKQGKITRPEAVELLMELEYSQARAELLIDINVPEDELDAVVEERKLSKADIKAALKAGVISEDEARKKLAELRYSAANITLLIRIFQAAIKPPAEETQRQASKADIVEGVKKGVISPEEGYVMLTEIGFSPEASNFILTVRAEESPFSPIDFTEFKALTSKYRQVVGMATLPVPDELREAARELVRLTAETASLERSVEEERRQLTDEETAPAPARKKLTELQIALNRARAELERVQLDYDSKVAAWKRDAGA